MKISQLVSTCSFAITCLLLPAAGSANPTLPLGEETIFAPYSWEELNSQNLWYVDAPSGLNCRTQPRLDAPIVYEAIPRDSLLRAINLVGTRGYFGTYYTWLKVVPEESFDHTPCFVAADRSFISQAPFDEVNQGSLFEGNSDFVCQSSFPGTRGATVVTTLNYVIYLCSDVGSPFNFRYYISYERSDLRFPALTLMANRYNPDQGSHFDYYNGAYTYRIHKPSAFNRSPNLNVIFPDGSGRNERILQWLD